MLRRSALALAAAACALLLGGCVAIKEVQFAQQDVVGDVRVTVTVCAVSSGATPAHPGCNFQTNHPGDAVDASGQLLIALRVTAGTGAPQQVAGTTNEAVPRTIELTRDATYEQALTTALPPGDGRRWIGYRSADFTFDIGPDGTVARTIATPIDLTLPRPADGGPFVGRLEFTPAVGIRGAGEAANPVVCDPSPFTFSGSTICIDHPTPAVIDLPYTHSVATRDFGIVAGSATASPGQTVNLPFGVRGAGPLPAGLTAALSASTTLPGASATPSLASAPLANGSDTRVTVPVAVPVDAGPGEFDVTLTARLENGQTRSTSAKLTVRDRQRPVASKLRVKPKRFRPATKRRPRRGTTVSYTLSEPATVQVAVQRCARHAKPKPRRRAGVDAAARKRRAAAKRGRCVRWTTLRGTRTLTGAAGANTFRFDGRVRGRALRPGAYRLALTPTDAAANVGVTARVAFAVRR